MGDDAIDGFLAAQRATNSRERMIAAIPAMAPSFRPYGAEWRALCAELGVPCPDGVVRIGDAMAHLWPFLTIEIEGRVISYEPLTPGAARSHRAYLESIVSRHPTLAPRAAMLPLFGLDGDVLLLDAAGLVHTFWFYEEERTAVVADSLADLLAR